MSHYQEPYNTMYMDPELSASYHYRPQYTKEVFSTIRDYVSRGQKTVPPFELAVDVCCGTGASTTPLAEFFQKVIGVDVSQSQMALAPRDRSNVEYRLASAYELTSFLEPESVDLVTVGLGIHFLDLDKFYAQVDCILKPGGSLIIYSVMSDIRVVPVEAGIAIHKTIDKITAPYYGPNYALFHKDFNLRMPYPDPIRETTLTLHRQDSLDDMFGFLRSNGEYNFYDRDFPEEDVYGKLRSQLEAIIGQEKSRDPCYDGTLDVTWPIVMIMNKKPQL